MNRPPRPLTPTWLVAGLFACASPAFSQSVEPPQPPPTEAGSPAVELQDAAADAAPEADPAANPETLPAPEPAPPAEPLAPLTPDELAPPAVLEHLFTSDGDPARPEQRTAEQLLADIPLPDAITNARPLADPPLAEALVAMLDQAEQAAAEGRYFDAITTLRDAHRLAPNHPRVLRALGLAYANSGNTVRGLSYLEEVVRHDPSDWEVLLILTRHARQRGDHAVTLGWTAALEQAAQADPPSEDTARLAEYFRALSFKETGQADAAIQLYQRVLSYSPSNDADPAVQREWFVIARRQSEMYLQLGDLLLSRGQVQAASEAYDRVDPQQLGQGSGFAARRIYNDLLLRDPASAIAHAVDHLASDKAVLDDVALIDYLLKQDIDAQALEAALDQRFDAQAGPLALLAGLARLKDLDQTLALAQRLLDDRGVSPADFHAILAVLKTDRTVLADPEALSRLARLTAHAMRQEPTQADAFARVLLELDPDPVALIRSLKRPELAESDDLWTHFAAGLSFVSVDRADLAEAAFERAIELGPNQPGPPFHLAKLLAEPELNWIELDERESADQGKIRRAAELLAGADATSDWPTFQLLLRVKYAQNSYGDVRTLIAMRTQRMGLEPDLRILRAKMFVQTRDYTTQTAVKDLRELIDQNPEYEPAYVAALELIDNNPDDNRFNNRNNNLPEMRQQIVASLIKNLPDSRSALMQQLLELWQIDGQHEGAEYLLLQMLELDPEDRLALLYLSQHYEEMGEADKAREYTRRYIAALPPGLTQRRMLMIFEFEAGNEQAVIDLVTRTLAEEEEGVMPGPALDGDLAAVFLSVLSLAGDDEASEAMYLKMLRRFPYTGQLNNSLGYRWALEGKNLIQARNMIQRAIDADGENYSYLDSMAWVLYKMGDFAQAEAYQSQAMALLLRQRHLSEPSRGAKAVLYNHMGDILYRNGDLPKAITNWQYARAQRLTEEDIAGDPELETLSDDVRAKISAALEGAEVPVADVPGEAAFGPEGHPADDVPDR